MEVFGSFNAIFGGFWELLESLLEDLGSILEVLETFFGAYYKFMKTFWENFRKAGPKTILIMCSTQVLKQERPKIEGQISS